MRAHFRFAIAIALAILVVTCTNSRADVRLPGFMNDHMVLQRDRELVIWGWAAPQEKVTVQLGEAAASTQANANGEWRVELPPQPAGGPLTLTVTGGNTLTVNDVLIGEVWLCSGQSNMEWVVQGSTNAAAEIQAANFPQIRHIQIPKRPSPIPQADVSAPWRVCSPETVGSFTAVGYFMARQLHQELGVPIGLVHSSWGGTRIEPWIPPAGFAQVPELKEMQDIVLRRTPGTEVYQRALEDYISKVESWTTQAKQALANKAGVEPAPAFPDVIKPLTTSGDPTALFNGMIAPLVGYPIRGAIWYQGESNVGEGMRYYAKMQALIGGWREVWGIGEFPFYYVQIAPFQYGETDPHILPAFWEAQAAAQQIPMTGMVVTNDIGTLNDIHPPNKQEVGSRLARLALKRTYLRADVVDSGPTFRELAIEGDQLVVSFDHAAGGLKSRDGKPLSHFEIIGLDTDWTPAVARMSGETVQLTAPGVAHPVAMRFAWHKLAQPNLVNGAGLPASAFRAGEVPRMNFLPQIEEAKAYQLVYDLDLANLSQSVRYDIDHRDKIMSPFDRIAYLLELQTNDNQRRFAYVSLDAFTDDLAKIGIPDLKSGAAFQKKVTGLTVVSNVSQLKSGTGLEGNIEFWPHNYTMQNAASIPGASNTAYDFGDMRVDPVDGYGCMQIHHFESGQTIFSINHWAAGPQADVGIGNSSGQHTDWTFTTSAAQYKQKRLRVLVRLKQTTGARS
jgi:sialate O-acetylesterase